MYRATSAILKWRLSSASGRTSGCRAAFGTMRCFAASDFALGLDGDSPKAADAARKPMAFTIGRFFTDAKEQCNDEGRRAHVTQP